MLDDLVFSLHQGLESGNLRTEPNSQSLAIDTPHRPLFQPQTSLNRRALHELRPILEAWIGLDKNDTVPLIGNNAYGLRIYRNQSRLNMHVDKRETHVISAILHVDHDENSEPWPIVIEDFKRHLNEVVLEKGDVLLYESSKCFHGRPRRFEGSYYS